MITEENQTHIDLSIIGYGNQAAFFKVGDDNSSYTPITSQPYTTIDFPIDFPVGSELTSDNESEMFITEQIKELRKAKFKLASRP